MQGDADGPFAGEVVEFQFADLLQPVFLEEFAAAATETYTNPDNHAG